MFGKQSPISFAVTCYPDSILRLRPDGWFNDELIDAVAGLAETPDSPQTHILPSHLYENLEKEDYAKADRWVKHFSHAGTRWAFGISRGLHWGVVLIDWPGRSILSYDPWQEENPNPARQTRTIKVSPIASLLLLSQVNNVSLSALRNGSPTSVMCITSQASHGK